MWGKSGIRPHDSIPHVTFVSTPLVAFASTLYVAFTPEAVWPFMVAISGSAARSPDHPTDTGNPHARRREAPTLLRIEEWNSPVVWGGESRPQVYPPHMERPPHGWCGWCKIMIMRTNKETGRFSPSQLRCIEHGFIKAAE